MPRSFKSSNPRQADERDEVISGKVWMEVDIPRDLAGLVIGKAGSTTRRIIHRTGADVHVSIPEVTGGRTFVNASGRIDQVQKVLDEVRDVVAKVNPECAQRLQGKFTMEPTVVAQNRETEELARSVSGGEGGSVREWGHRDITARLTISAKKATFKCLIGQSGENLKKIRDTSAAPIEVEDYRQAGEIQHAIISGGIEDVIAATLKVKESLRRYRPDRDPRENFRSRDPSDRLYLTGIRAEAVVKIKAEAAGFFIGKKGENIKKITYETDVDHLEVNAEPRGGFKDVNIVGDVNPVLQAMRKIQDSIRRFLGNAVKAEDTSTSSDIAERQAELPPASDPRQTPASIEPVTEMPPAPTTAFPPMPLAPNMALPSTFSAVQQFAQPTIVYTQDGQMMVLIPTGDGTCRPHLLPEQPVMGSQQSAGPPVFPVSDATQLLPQHAGPPGFPALDMSRLSQNTGPPGFLPFDTKQLPQNTLPPGLLTPSTQELSGMPDEVFQLAEQLPSSQIRRLPVDVYETSQPCVNQSNMSAQQQAPSPQPKLFNQQSKAQDNWQ